MESSGGARVAGYDDIATVTSVRQLWIVGRRDRLHSWKGAEGVDDSLMQSWHGRGSVAGELGIDTEGHQVRGVEADVDLAQILQSANKQAGCQQKKHA